MIDCHHFPNWEPAECEQTSDGSIVLSRKSLADITFRPEGLGSVIVDDRGLYFVSRRGRTALAFMFDNGTDNVVEGVTRTVKDGKIGSSIPSSMKSWHQYGTSPFRSSEGLPRFALDAFPFLYFRAMNIES
jgi:hypothetical protein